jgi:lambda family phage minor tail protein L
MSVDPAIAVEIQKLDPSAVIELFELDTTELGGEIFRFHNGTNKLAQNLVWQGEEYIRFPIQVTGFEFSGQGQFPRPQVTVSNALSAITTVLLQYGDLIGAKFTRKRTLLKYLDAVNFPGGVNPDADDSVFLADDIYYVDRKSSENRDQVQFELASAADLQGVKVPRRTVIQSICPWIYRGPDCGYTGVPLYDESDDELPMPSSAEAIAMRNAFQDLLDARDALAAAQQDLADKSAALTSAAVYDIEVQYNRQGVGPNPSDPDYFVSVIYGIVTARWNNNPVTLGTEYVQGAWKDTVSGGYWYNIERHTRNETAYNNAVADYDAAVIARDAAQDDVDDAQDDFDTALAAVPADDPVFAQDRCGKRLTSCRLRFNTIADNHPLNFGAFPGVSR